MSSFTVPTHVTVFLRGILHEFPERQQKIADSRFEVCANCRKILKYHIDMKCPFDSTGFFPIYERDNG